MEKVRRISFSVTDDEYNLIKKTAGKEGLTPSQFVKRSTIIAINTPDYSMIKYGKQEGWSD